jgi:hypothetical protein
VAVRSGILNTEKREGHQAPLRRVVSADEAPQAIFQSYRMEIQQQANGNTAHAEVSLQLRVVCREQSGYRFDLQDHDIVHQDIGAESQRNRHAFVGHRDADLARQRNAGVFQFETQTGGVNRVQQTRPGLPMHLYRQPDDAFRQRLMLKHEISPWPLVALAVSP